jgi:hypothetical protein
MRDATSLGIAGTALGTSGHLADISFASVIAAAGM